jgi:hypothetical protein
MAWRSHCTYRVFPEDVDENNTLDRWGAANVGSGLALIPAINTRITLTRQPTA